MNKEKLKQERESFYLFQSSDTRKLASSESIPTMRNTYQEQ